MGSPEAILIASTSSDILTVGPVRDELNQLGHEVTFYDTQAVLSGADRLVVGIGAAGLKANLGVTDFVPENFGAAWYRRPSDIELDSMPPINKIEIIDNIAQLQAGIWSQIPEDRWLNDPTRMRQADNKVDQLAVALEAGCDIPKTVVTNDGQQVLDEINSEIIAFKLPRGVITLQDERYPLFTQMLNREQIERLIRGGTNFFPGIFQEAVEKAKEWRVTIVDGEVFPVAIYTTEAAKDDWRRHQMESSVVFKSEELEDRTCSSLQAILKHYGLRFGTFDLIETPEGKIVFLELNPNGQYQWVVDELGLAIPKAIARSLSKIALN